MPGFVPLCHLLLIISSEFITLGFFLTTFFFFSRKVMIMEDPDQNIHLKNLSLQQSANEEEALNLLFLGDTNRMIAEVRKRETHASVEMFD